MGARALGKNKIDSESERARGEGAAGGGLAYGRRGVIL